MLATASVLQWLDLMDKVKKNNNNYLWVACPDLTVKKVSLS